MILGVIGPWQVIIILIVIAFIAMIGLLFGRSKQVTHYETKYIFMKYCPKCGNAVSDQASFCPKCGANIPDATTPTPLSQNYQQSPMPPCPPTYLALSIIVTVLCCLPFGIVGIIKSSSVSKEYAVGNYAGAQEASKQAKTWSIVGLCCGLFWVIIYIILMACGVMAGIADI